MLPSKAINLFFIILVSSAVTNGVRRKSKIELPIANAAEAPFDDNVAVASENEPTHVDAPSSIVDKPQQPSAAAISLPSSTESPEPDNAAASGENDINDCDPDMIGFEIITG